MAGGELAAAFEGLAEDAAQAGESIGSSLARFTEDTADIEEENVSRTLAADAENARLLEAIKPDTGNLDGAGAGSGSGESQIARILSGEDPGGDAAEADGADAGGTGAGSEPGLSDATAKDPAAAEDPSARCTGGDPVDVATGDVVMSQADVTLPGTLPLVLERTHRSSHRTGRWLGASWTSSFDQRLEVAGDRVRGAFADGRVLTWDLSDASEALPETGPVWPLRRLADGGYEVTDRQRGLTWRFEHRAGYWSAGFGGGMAELPLVSVADRAGHFVAFEYGESGQPAAVAHSGGYRVDVTVRDGRITGLFSGTTPLVFYEYDDGGQLAGVINSSGQALRFTYGAEGRLTGWTDRNGQSYRYTFDSAGRCVAGASPSGALSGTFSYAPGVTRWTDGAGFVTTYGIDADAQVTAITDPLGNTTRFTHDPRGRIISQADPLGRVTRYGFDEAGNLVTVTRPDGETARADYDDQCQPVEMTEFARDVWRQDFDSLGNRMSLTRPGGAVTRWEYDAAGHLAAIIGPDGLVTRVECDAAGLILTAARPDGAVTRYERDEFGRTVRVTDPDGGVTAITWTPEGRPAARTLPDGSAETWEWDGEGNLVRHVSVTGAVTSCEYGPFDVTTGMTRPDGTATSFGYDHDQRLRQVTYGGLTWLYEYDHAGRLTAETDYNGAVTRYGYDAAGQLIRRINAAGQEISFGYDALGNVVSQTADGAVTTFGYDTAGRLVQARNADAELSIERDPLGRVIAETCNGRTVRTSYDAAGRVVSRTTPSGAVSDWAYDGVGLSAALTSGGQELRFEYGPAGLETLRDLPGGAVLAQDWDTSGRLTMQTLTHPGPVALSAGGGPEGPSVPGEVLQRRSYDYSPDGFVTGLSDALTGNRAFGLDPSGRVTTVNGPEWNERYVYDPVGNMTDAAWPAVPSELAGGWLGQDSQGAREVTGTLTGRAGNIQYRHDAAGRVVTRIRTRLSRKPEVWQYQWDADDRLTAVTTPDGSIWRYRHDPLGRRIAKQHVSVSGEVLSETRFMWDGPVLAEQAEMTADREQFTTWDYHPGTFTPVTQASRAISRDAPQEMVDEQFYSIITDLTGTPAELVAADGALAGYQQHTLWGGTVWHPSGASTPLRFPGQYDDRETGLHYNNQRYYDPVTGAYLSPDPLGLGPAPNPHSYADNPHVFIDPLGLMTCKEQGLADAQKRLTDLQSAPDGGDTDVVTRLDAGGKSYYGVNAHGQVYPRPPGVTPFSTGHAEEDAFGQAARDGVSGGAANLYVAGKIPCPYCKSSMAGWAKNLDLDQLNVYGPNGYIGQYVRGGGYRTIDWGTNPH